MGKIRLKKLDSLLSQILVADINSEDVLQRYAEIDCFTQGKLDGRPLPMSARNMAKNDLWIAATTSVLGATLLTADDDFDHLQNEFLQVAKIGLS